MQQNKGIEPFTQNGRKEKGDGMDKKIRDIE